MTFIAFPNLIINSPNQVYQLKILGNSKEEFFRNQSEFVYSLHRQGEIQPLWQWQPTKQQHFADYPAAAYLSDEGWVVVILREWFHSGLLVLSPSGEFRMLRLIQSHGDKEAGFLEDESDLHIGGGSAGPNWYATSIVSFHNHLYRKYCTVLTWWGRRIFVDLDKGQILDKVPPEQVELAQEQEEKWILQQLHVGTDLLLTEDNWESLEWAKNTRDTYTATYHAGTSGINSSVTYLHMIEASPIIGYETSELWMNTTFMMFRFAIKMSLLRLNVEPKWFSNYVVKKKLTKELCRYPDQRPKQIENILSVGMNQKTMLEKVGVPEYIGNAWFYLVFDGLRVSTIRIHWFNKYELKYNNNDIEQFRKDHEAYQLNLENDPPVCQQIERIDRPIWELDDYLKCRISPYL
jgi:hypothetical protein